jgi:penicillin amidase
MMVWQADTFSFAAVRLLPFLFKAALHLPEKVTPRMKEALEKLGSWDHTSPTGLEAFYRQGPPGEEEIGSSVAASIFHAWLNRLLASTIQAAYQRFGQDPPDVDMQTRAIIFLLEHPSEARTGQRLFDDRTTAGHIEIPDETLLTSLEKSLHFLGQFFGTEDMDTWRWGTLHQVRFLLGYEDVSLPLFPVQGPFPKSGANFTVDASDFGSNPSSFDTNVGPNTRFVMELEPGVLRSVNAQPGGQSENPESPHYADLTELWLDYRYEEIYFWLDDVLAHQETSLTFKPKP